MKPTQVAELFANIKATIVSFFSILMFVALGAGIFAGIYWSSPALENAVDETFEQGAMHHVQVQFPYGLTDGDLEQLASLEGVADVEPARTNLVRYDSGKYPSTFMLQTLGQRIDVPQVVEGSLPARSDEMALQASTARKLGLAVGDKVTFVHDGDSSDKDGMAHLVHDAYTVTALVESPEYISLGESTLGFSSYGSGSVKTVGWLTEDAFDDAAYRKGYTVANLRCSGLEDLGSFSDAYKQASEEVEKRIEALGTTLAAERCRSLRAEAESAVADGEAKLSDAQRQIAEGEQSMENGESELQDARNLLDSKTAEGESQLAGAYAELVSDEKQKSEAETELAEKRAELAAAQAELAEVDAALTAASAATDEASGVAREQAQILAGEKKAYEDAVKLHDEGKISDEELAAAEARYQTAQQTCNDNLDAAGTRLAAAVNPLAEMMGIGKLEIDHGNLPESIAYIEGVIGQSDEMVIEFEGRSMKLGEARAEVAKAASGLEAAQAELEKKTAQLAAGWEQYHANRDLLASEQAAAERKIAEGEAQLAASTKELEDGKAAVAEKSAELDDARKQLDEFTERGWSVTPRMSNGGAMQASMISDVMGRLAFSMAALFVIVGLLVSYSAVSRIVHEQVVQIGTKKALGLRGREITLGFLAYAGLAVIAGSVIGIAVGVNVVERIIAYSVGSRFTFGAYDPYFGLPLALVVSAIELVLILGATWLACRRILRSQAVELLRGERPPEGKTRFYERWALWNKLPLFTQTMVNNCLNDKRRLFSTIVGVAGCTALVVTALTLNDNVMRSYEIHYDNVYGFDTVAYVDADHGNAADTVLARARDKGYTAAAVSTQPCVVEFPDGTCSTMRFIVADDPDEFAPAYHVNPVGGGAADVDLGGDDVWVSRACAAHLGVSPGDTISLMDAAGTKHEVTVTGFHEYYLCQYEIVMGRGSYERAFGSAPTANAVLAGIGDRPFEEAEAELGGLGGIDEIVDDKSVKKADFDDFARISRTVVLVYLILAILMAAVVLLNLNIMFIEEKKRELIVLMINGFSVHDAKRYIYNDTIVLTVLGIVLGLVLGAIMGSVTVEACETSVNWFYKGVDWLAIAVGAAASAVLSLIMSMIALRRIPRFNLTDINKM